MYSPVTARQLSAAGGLAPTGHPRGISRQSQGVRNSLYGVGLIALFLVIGIVAVCGRGWIGGKFNHVAPSLQQNGPSATSGMVFPGVIPLQTSAPTFSYPAPVQPTELPVVLVSTSTLSESVPSTSRSVEKPDTPKRCTYASTGGSSAPDPSDGPGLWCNKSGTDVPEVCVYNEPGEEIHVKILTYNLYWYAFSHTGGPKARGALIASTNRPVPYDFMGFQECEDANVILANAGLAGQYIVYPGPDSIAMAVRKARWTVLAHGQADVAEDSRLQYFGKRMAQWARVRDKASKKTVFFMNHHGPTPIGSGGLCGGEATATNLLMIIRKKSKPSDAVVLVGDFNADPFSTTFKALSRRLHPSFAFTPHGDVDQIFTNLGPTPVVHKQILPGGGSDHHPLSAILRVRKVGAHPGKAPFEQPVFVGWAPHT